MSSQNLPWTEKYRPKTTQEVVSHQALLDSLRGGLASGELPHLLFYGPPGTGKTSTILGLCRELFGVHCRDRVLELNASDERGISVIRQKVKDFAKTVVSGDSPLPFKLIILDEADSMTPDAQAALRRTMEIYSKTTRFCIICNYLHKIMDPLASRCTKFHFKPLPVNEATRRLGQICGQENIVCSADVLEYLVRLTNGDLRKAINHLQSSSILAENGKISLPLVRELVGAVPDDDIARFLQDSRNTPDKGIVAAQELSRQGYSVRMVVQQLQEHILSAKLSDIRKSLFLLKLSCVLEASHSGADGELQLQSLASFISQVSMLKHTDAGFF